MTKEADVCAMQVKVHISGESESATKMNLRAGKFKMIIDEPANMGGTDEGPSPVQMLLTALAGCLNVTGFHVAKERGLNLEKMKISIEGDMNPCTFMGCSFEERAGFQDIIVKIKPTFKDAVEESVIEDWVKETEARCPVTDNIKDGTKILVENI
jgi:uncharacterized OsmC-like protein